ncbi:MAG: ArsR/SmtB family transcription factor [Desulfobacterales bacterium]
MSLSKSLKALSDENRLKILRMLAKSDLCVGALAKQLGISKPAVSQHLQTLRKTGLVMGEKRGYWTHYQVDREALARIADEIRDLTSGDHLHETICWRINEAPVKPTQSEEVEMCLDCCQQPDRLEGQPENCSSEQISQCHGDAEGHPCAKEVPPEPEPSE